MMTQKRKERTFFCNPTLIIISTFAVRKLRSELVKWVDFPGVSELFLPTKKQ